MSLSALETWDETKLPTDIAGLEADPEYQALAPRKKIAALNAAQAQWATTLRNSDPKEYPNYVRDLEADFNNQRRSIIQKGLTDDLASGRLTDKQIADYWSGGVTGVSQADGEAARYIEDRFGSDDHIAGPWKTTKLPITGADGQQQGFAYIRHVPGMTGQTAKGKLSVSSDERIYETPYVASQPGDDLAEVSYTFNTHDGKQITGVEDVNTGPEFARAMAIRRQSEYEKKHAADFEVGGVYDDTPTWGKVETKTTEPDALDSIPDDKQPAFAAVQAFAKQAQNNPAISKHIGQGFWAGLPGEALKGVLETGAAAVYGPRALLGDKEAARTYQNELKQIGGDIEGQSRLVFEGGTVNNMLKTASHEVLTTILGGGAGSFAAKRLGTAAIKSQIGRELANRAINAVAFLPQSMRGGLDNMVQTLDKADEYRASAEKYQDGPEKDALLKKANDIEDNAVMNGWFGTLMETASENMWLNEMLVTKAGRPLRDVADSVLQRQLSPTVMDNVKRGMLKVLEGANQEGIEEVVSGIGNGMWMSAFAEQNPDIVGDIPDNYLGGALMGGFMGAVQALRNEAKGDAQKEAILRTAERAIQAEMNRSGDDPGLAEIRAEAERIQAERENPSTQDSPTAVETPAGNDATSTTSLSGQENDQTPTPASSESSVVPAGEPPAVAPVTSQSVTSVTDVTPVEPVAPQEPAAKEVTPPQEFRPVAPVETAPDTETVAGNFEQANAEAAQVAEVLSQVPGAEQTAEALASIAADDRSATEPPSPVAIADVVNPDTGKWHKGDAGSLLVRDQSKPHQMTPDEYKAAPNKKTGEPFKTKKEAVEEGLRLVRRRQVYNGLLALRGKLQWDDSDVAWANARAQELPALVAQEPQSQSVIEAKAARSAKTPKPVVAKRSKAK